MSFKDLDVDLENQKPFSDSPEFDKLIDQSSNLLLDINNNLLTLEKFIKSLKQRKSSKNTNNVSDKAFKSIEQITDLFKNISILNKRISTFEDINPAQIFSKDKISREIKNSLDEFQDLQEEFKNITNSLNDETKAALDQDALNKQDISLQQEQNQNQELILEEDLINNEEFTYQQNLIQERENEIQNIEQGIQELNEIFSDLGAIVQEQGTMVDNIESNIFDVSQSTKIASNELTKALRYQRSSRKKTFCLFMILVVILLVVLLGIFL